MPVTEILLTNRYFILGRHQNASWGLWRTPLAILWACVSAELGEVIFLLRMFDTQRHLRAARSERRRDRERIKNDNAVYALSGNNKGHDPVEALKHKLGALTETEWNNYRWFGMPRRLRDDQLQ